MIPPVLLYAGYQLARRLGLLNVSSGGSRPTPMECDIYCIPECEIEAFVRAHPDATHYTTCAEKLTKAGNHELASKVTRRGRELEREYGSNFVVACCDLRTIS